MGRFSIGDYKAKFNDVVTELVVSKIPDRTERMADIDALINEYVQDTCTLPDDKQLERLTDAILMEELLDDNQWKVKQTEYPFFSETQLARRKDGVHQRKNEAGNREVDLSKAWAVDMNGRDWSLPKRRERSNNENIFIDVHTKSRNKERRDKYLEFTHTQPIISYTLSKEEMEARGWL